MTRCPRCQTEVPENGVCVVCAERNREYARAVKEFSGCDASMYNAVFAYGVIVGKRTPPTPASLREMAAWFDQNTPYFDVIVGEHERPPGYLLRKIADELEREKR